MDLIPRGHLLGHPRYWRGLYVATCCCGLDIFASTLPRLWAAHQAHLDATRAACQANHPSRRKP